MAKREILVLPDARLRQVAGEIPVVDAEIKKLAADMLETMYDAPGIGLAAPQIGELKRIVVMDLSKDGEPNDPIVMINPEILKYSDDTVTTEEGCLSIPGLYVEIVRPKQVLLRGIDIDGNTVEFESDDFEARLFQHELDHLNGVLMFDRMTPEQRKEAIAEYQRISEQAANAAPKRRLRLR